jgi:pyruvate formate lyase activating enzyme
LIFNIQYFCVHDGPGIRTAVFFKGCPLSCAWCHNPEGIPKARLLSFVEGKCVFCGECAKVCPEAHGFNNGKHVIFRERCPDELLDASAASCAAKALTVVGESISAGELIDRFARDRRYYEASGGGVTFSGGEPTVQKAFLSAALRLCAHEGLHAALETCGVCDYA